jgi:hypothetical protein
MAQSDLNETFQVNADIFVQNTAPEWFIANTQLSKISHNLQKTYLVLTIRQQKYG